MKESSKGKGQSKGNLKFAGVLDEASIFSGTHRDSGEAMVSPPLLEWVGREVEKETMVIKQVRKAREERRLAGSSKPPKDA
eukprot:6485809-Amphidinium_carterae.1